MFCAQASLLTSAKYQALSKRRIICEACSRDLLFGAIQAPDGYVWNLPWRAKGRKWRCAMQWVVCSVGGEMYWQEPTVSAKGCTYCRKKHMASLQNLFGTKCDVTISRGSWQCLSLHGDLKQIEKFRFVDGSACGVALWTWQAGHARRNDKSEGRLIQWSLSDAKIMELGAKELHRKCASECSTSILLKDCSHCFKHLLTPAVWTRKSVWSAPLHNSKPETFKIHWDPLGTQLCFRCETSKTYEVHYNWSVITD